jgi:hypothetical protein
MKELYRVIMKPDGSYGVEVYYVRPEHVTSVSADYGYTQALHEGKFPPELNIQAAFSRIHVGGEDIVVLGECSAVKLKLVKKEILHS